MIDLWLVWMTGVLASLHCAGMCGPIVLAYSMTGACGGACPAAVGGSMKLHVAYNAGRIAAYAALGAIAGLAGQSLTSLKLAAPYVALAGGVLMILTGALMLGVLPLPNAIRQGSAGQGVARLHGAVIGSRTAWSKSLIGLLTPLLPCGVLYAMAIKAATTQSVGRGALVMAVFGVGMAPALMTLGGLSSLVSMKVRRGAERLAAASVMLMGVFLVLRGLGVPYLSWIPMGGMQSAPCCCH